MILRGACLAIGGLRQAGAARGAAATAARATADAVLSIPQFGSTRSINAGVASGIAMFEWIRRHA